MTQRKPADVKWSSWIEQQLESARSRGEFDTLPGKGKPLPGIDEPYDELWWVKSKLRQEKLAYAPKTLDIRHKTEAWLEGFLRLPSAYTVQRQATDLNEEIAEANRGDLGPLLPQPLLDVEDLCRRWKEQHQDA